MGPIRGLKRRKKAEKGIDRNGAHISPGNQAHQGLDWWEDFSKRITGTFDFTISSCFAFTLFASYLDL